LVGEKSNAYNQKKTAYHQVGVDFKEAFNLGKIE
jgi:hypothetical protein